VAKKLNDDPSIVRTKKPKASELNKKTIMIASTVGGLLILFAFLFSINTGEKKVSSTSSNLKSRDLSVKTKTGRIGVGGYQDSKQIDKILGLNKKPEVIEKMPAALKQQLEALKSQQSQLQSELSRLRSQKQQKAYVAPVKKPSSPMDREAMQAALFFPGGAPAPVPQKKQATKKTGTKNEQEKLEQKQQFMAGKVNKDVTNPNTIQYPISKYTLFAGTVIPGVLKTKLVSTLPGNIVALVNQDVYDSVTGQYLLIPRGSTLIGQYNSSTTFGEDQLQAKFLRVIRPDGSSIVLPNQPGVNSMGVSGFADTVDNHWWSIIGAGVLSAVFSIPSIAAQYAVQGQQGFNSSGNYQTAGVGTTIGGAGLGAIGQSTSQIGSQIASKALNQKPTITIHEGYQFSILVTKDIVIPPQGVHVTVDLGDDEDN
jgi:type IV secretory pathway VirB10-like protein